MRRVLLLVAAVLAAAFVAPARADAGPAFDTIGSATARADATFRLVA